MPVVSRLMSPARSIRRWLTTSASAGSSRDVERKNCETRMIAVENKSDYSTGLRAGCDAYEATADGAAVNFARWLWRRATGDGGSVYITERFGVRSLHIDSNTIQSSMRLARPNELELAYTRSMMAFLLFNERPARVLMVGLGGGSLAKFIYHRMPDAHIEVIEINPQVVAVARSHFHLPADDARLTVRTGDGAEWLARPGAAADVIIVDGYDG